MKIVNESTQMVHISPTMVLTPSVIGNALQKAYSDKMYAKFYTDKFFIQVNFMRDQSIQVSSNIRNSVFLQELWKNHQLGWNMSRVKSFIYRWMQLSRSSLH